MYGLHRELIESLTATPETLAGLLHGVNEAQARSAKGGDENWSVIEVICHLRDAEEISYGRMKAMRDQDDPEIISYDQEALARERKYSEADLDSALAGFARLRAEHVAALAALIPQEWERTGHHNEIGQISIVAHTIHKTYHDAIHCAQIARQLTSAS
jgi:hypothetical protein